MNFIRLEGPFYKKQEDGTLRHETELIVDRGIEFIENQPRGKPFALIHGSIPVMQRMGIVDLE